MIADSDPNREKVNNLVLEMPEEVVSFVAGCVILSWMVISITACGSFRREQTLAIKETPADRRHVISFLPDDRVQDTQSRELYRPCTCTEPSPDVAFNKAYDLSLASQGLDSSTMSASAKLTVTRSIVDLAKRSQTLQLVREMGYRICEARCNGMSEGDPLLQALMSQMKDLLTIELKNADREYIEAITVSRKDSIYLRELYRRALPDTSK